jgi:nucleotide-binding universal stress UspA family protein
MYEKILVPLDGSKRAEMILPHVEDMASRYQAEVILLNSIEHFFSPNGEGIFIEFSIDDFNREQYEAYFYLRKIAEDFAGKKIKAEIRLAAGPPVDAIIETANKDNVDLIAMASDGGGASSRVIYGSVSAGVLNKVDRSLLIIRSRNE